MISKDDRETVERWFETHKATLLKDRYSRIIDWRKPDTRSYAVTYTWQGSYMIVTGDLGITVFQVPAMSFEFFDDCELDYLIGKIVATSHSRQNDRVGYQWDSDAAKKHILAIKPNRWLTLGDRQELRKLRNILAENCHTKQEMLNQAHRYSEDLEYIFGYDWYDILPQCYAPDLHITSHYLGLKMAIAQLKEQGVSIEG